MMPESPPGAVIRDVDGTLVDTAELHFRAWLAKRSATRSINSASWTLLRRHPWRLRQVQQT
jgi:beta-phosphoglucomutase-like phosphatase (HAD superfamily)